MSALAGVIHFDGRPAAIDDAARLLAHLRHRLTTPASITADGPAVLGAGRPVASAAGAVRLAFDGRLHNRAELAAALSITAGASDEVVIAAAYDRWDVDLAEHLVGAFALALWDGRRRRLFAARDIMGARPFCYRQTAAQFAWASEPQALVRHSPRRINEGHVAEHLAGTVVTLTETLYADVHRLPAAHALTVSADGAMRTWRYWQPACEPLAYRDERDYVQHAAALMADAVAGCIDDDEPITLSLSGGIDSAAIAASAAGLRDAGRRVALAAVTVGFAGHAHDETARAREVAARTGFPWRGVPATDVSDDYFAVQAAAALDLPEPPNAAVSLGLRSLASRRGPVLLSGVGGDEWFFGSDGALADLIAAGRVGAAARWLHAAGRGPEAVPFRRMLWWGIWGATPDPVKRAVRRALRRPAIPAWIAAGFARRTSLRDRIAAAAPVPLPTRAATTMFDDATCGEVAWRREFGERIAARSGLEERYPFGDRRLIEFAFAIPDNLRYRDGRPKWILRNAFGHQLPLWAQDVPPGADFSWLYAARLERMGGEQAILATMPVTSGWIEPDAVRRLYAAMLGGRTTRAGLLWNIVAVDLWLRGLDRDAVVAGDKARVYDTAPV